MALQIPDDQLLKARWLLSSEKERATAAQTQKGKGKGKKGKGVEIDEGCAIGAATSRHHNAMLGLHKLSVLAMKETQSPKEEGQGAAGLVRGFTQGAEKFRQQTASKIAGHGGGENCQVILSGLTDLVDIANPGRKGAVSRPRGAKARREPEVRDLGAESASLSKLLLLTALLDPSAA